MASFRLFAWRYHDDKTKRRHTKRRKDDKTKRRQDEKTTYEKTKRRHTKKRKDAMRKDDKIKVSNGIFSHGVFFFFFFHHFALKFRLFAWRYFVFLHGVFSSFRVASIRREKTKRHNPATIYMDGWMDVRIIYRRSTLKGHIASKRL